MTHAHAHRRYLQEQLAFGDHLFPHSRARPASWAVLRPVSHLSVASHEQCACGYLRRLDVYGKPNGEWISYADWQACQLTMELRGV